MTALLDEGVPIRLARALAEVGCRVLRFPNEWKGLKNGKLVERLVETRTRCLVTCDKNFHHQQNIARHGVSLVVLPRQRFEDLLPLLDEIAAAIERVEAGQVIAVEDREAIDRSDS